MTHVFVKLVMEKLVSQPFCRRGHVDSTVSESQRKLQGHRRSSSFFCQGLEECGPVTRLLSNAYPGTSTGQHFALPALHF